MAKCEHDIGFEFKYGFGDVISEEKLYETILENIQQDYSSGTLNFRRKNYMPLNDYNPYIFYFFDYCPWCGEKLDEKAITKRLNERAKQYVRNIDREKYKLDLIASTKKEKSEKNQEKVNCLEVGYVYLIKMGDSYKIGISKNPSQRFKEFTKLPYPIEEIFVEEVNGYDIVEEELHSIFANKRKRGEWFDLNEQDIDFIKDYLIKRKV